MRTFQIILLLSLLPLFGFATTIKCNNAEYSNKKLDFYTYSDPVSSEKELVFTLEFNSDGKCTSKIDENTTLYSFSEFGLYRGMLFVEPGKTIELKLPPFREKSFADQKNPYFSPVTFWVATENKTDLNNKISGFDHTLSRLTDKFFDQLYFQQSKETYDSLIFLINKDFPETIPETFALHKKLKIKLVNADIFRLKPEQYSEIFNSINSKFWMHPAFLQLFDKTFGGQLSYTAKSIKGGEVNKAVNSKNLPWLLNFVKTKYKVSGKMAELVLLKMLHDGYYSGDFPKSVIKEMVNADLFRNNSNSLIKKASENIDKKFSFLQKGNSAPPICLNDLKDQTKCTNSNSDKFKYIVFADVEMIVCREHLKYLSKIDEMFQKYLEIYVVLRDTETEDINTFFKENELPAIKLTDTDNKYAEQYKIKSFPQCFLLDEKHKIVFTNTKAPLDGFEQQFGTYLRNELFMRQRNTD